MQKRPKNNKMTREMDLEDEMISGKIRSLLFCHFLYWDTDGGGPSNYQGLEETLTRNSIV